MFEHIYVNRSAKQIKFVCAEELASGEGCVLKFASVICFDKAQEVVCDAGALAE
jgi:hypothetical protein